MLKPPLTPPTGEDYWGSIKKVLTQIKKSKIMLW